MPTYEPTWQSLKQYTVPDWFRDAKLGIFIHWGVYSVPAYASEWYPRNMYKPEEPAYAHHRKTWGADFGYKDFVPMFKGEQFDPAAWVSLFQEAGAKYVVPVAEHHDGFPMYATDYTRWNSVNMGPKRDITAELMQATRQAGLKFGVSSHRAFNWRFFSYGHDFDTNYPATADLYSPAHEPDQPATLAWLTDWHARTRELIDKFEPDLLWFDFGWHEPEFTPYWPEVTAYYYNQAEKWGREVVLNYKDKFPPGVAVYDVERGKLSGINDVWQTDTSVSYLSWSYVENDEFKSVKTLVHELVDIVSKNGNLLLNVGPRADGIITEEPTQLLRDLGSWLKQNGEAIYGTRPWDIFGTGEAKIADGWHTERKNEPLGVADLRFTRKGDDVYVLMPEWPQGQVVVEPMGAGSSISAETIDTISLLGGPDKLTWQQTDQALIVQLPDEAPNPNTAVIKIKRS